MYISVNKDITALLLGGIGLVVTLLTVFAQLRAKVRSENRQKWVNEVRGTLSIVMNHIPKTGMWGNRLTDPCEPNQARLRLELLLNPSEKDHRTLGVLLRKAYGLRETPIDEPVLEILPEIKNLDPWSCETNRDKLMTWIIRLSNAMLKREWEQVKLGK